MFKKKEFVSSLNYEKALEFSKNLKQGHNEDFGYGIDCESIEYFDNYFRITKLKVVEQTQDRVYTFTFFENDACESEYIGLTVGQQMRNWKDEFSRTTDIGQAVVNKYFRNLEWKDKIELAKVCGGGNIQNFYMTINKKPVLDAVLNLSPQLKEKFDSKTLRLDDVLEFLTKLQFQTGYL